MIVIGTAGHIDHGKSSIVRRLTGMDPDRLPEERERGMTIDLGFAFYRTPHGEEIAFVDVPGHERFVKNMIAGAGGMDAVALVIAADDGWMPQSQEHFQITRLLGIRTGLIVINKIDLVESDWLELLEADIRERVEGSFLAEAPIVKVSAESGDGFDELIDVLEQVSQQVLARDGYSKARLFIDRSFVRPGIGGVVTGTLRGGTLSMGQTVSLWPSMVTGKIRTLQSQNDDVSTARPGQRTAVSLTGVDREQLVRGGVISDRTDLSYFANHPVLALAVEMLPESPLSLTDRREALVIVGTTESEGEIRIFDKEEISPGERGIVFYKPRVPMYALIGDHCILRLPTPMLTLGGGIVLDHLARFPRRKDLPSFEYLTVRTGMSIDNMIRSELQKRCFVQESELLKNADLPAGDISAQVESLVQEEVVGRFEGFVYGREVLNKAVSHLTDIVGKELQSNAHLKGLSADRITSLSSYPTETVHILIAYMTAEKILVRAGDEYNIAGRSMTLKGVVKQAHDEIISKLEADPYAPPTLGQLAAGGKVFQQAIKYILDTGEGRKCGSEFVFLTGVWDETIRFIRQHLEKQGKLTVGELRDRFGYTRKYAIPILEETDRIGITRREGDVRIKGEKFESPDATI